MNGKLLHGIAGCAGEIGHVMKDSATREEKAFPLADIYEDFAAIYDEMTMPKLD